MFQSYVVTNTVNGKSYVGITSIGVESRWRSHVKEAQWSRGGWALHRAIKKYGRDAFVIRQVASATSWSDMCAVERVLIAQHQTLVPLGYNMTLGGDGVVGLSAEKRQEIGRKLRGRKHSAEAIAKIAAASRGHKVSAEARQRLRAKHLGKTLSDAHRQKLSAAKLGKKRSPRSAEHSARIGEGLRRAWARRRVV